MFSEGFYDISVFKTILYSINPLLSEALFFLCLVNAHLCNFESIGLVCFGAVECLKRSFKEGVLFTLFLTSKMQSCLCCFKREI